MSDPRSPQDKFVDEFAEDFFAECEEHLAVVRGGLLALDKFVGKPRVDGRLVEELFHSLHTLKGLSGMAAMRESEAISHRIESYLRSLRVGAGPDAKAMDALMAGAKMLEACFVSRRAKENPPDVSGVLDRLSKALPAEAVSAGSAARRVVTSDGSMTLKDEENARLSAAMARGEKIWLCEFNPTPALSERGISVSVVRARLQEKGEVIHASPRINSAGGVSFHFLLAASVDESVFSAWGEDGLLFTPYEASAETSNEPSSVPMLSPSNMVRVDLSRLDDLMRQLGELVVTRSRLAENVANLSHKVDPSLWRPLSEINQALERQIRDLREGVMRVRLVRVGEAFSRMEFAVRDLARESGKNVRMALGGHETEIDKFVVERLMEPLLHLVRNAVSHGLEREEERVAAGKAPEGTISLRASAAGDTIRLEIEDDGRGVDAPKVLERARAAGLRVPEGDLNNGDLLDILCAPGFSTRDEADLASGRGVGMAVVRDAILELGGALSFETQAGRGTRFAIQLPLTLAIVDALMVQVADQTFAVPLPAVAELIEVDPTSVVSLENNEIVSYRNGVLPLARLSDFIGAPRRKSARALHAFVARTGENPVGLVVDRFLGQKEIVVHALKDPLVDVVGISGATPLGDGRVALILDAPAVARFMTASAKHRRKSPVSLR
jgi:two-component system, chemotaxis family, sensor kinase CheA